MELFLGPGDSWREHGKHSRAEESARGLARTGRVLVVVVTLLVTKSQVFSG